MRRTEYPFAAIVGHLAAKHALLLLAVEPGLRGVLIGSTGGSDDARLARAFGSLLPAPVSDLTRSSVNPAGELACIGVVDLPLNITEDRLLGELDLERTIATGKRHISTGLLARANEQVLFANDINLLDSGVAAQVAQAIDSRRVRLEREGIGAVQEADFRFVGVFNSNEGDPNPLLRSRVGLIVDSPDASSPAEKAVVVERGFQFDIDPDGLAEEFESENTRLKREIEGARARLPRVRVSKTKMRQISHIAVRLGVEGNRADVFALKAARASAALAGRNSVTEDDLVIAVQLVLAPRATTLPYPPEKAKEETQPSQRDDTSQSRPTDIDHQDHDAIAGSLEDIVFKPIDTRVPNDLIPAEKKASRHRDGKRFKSAASVRGQYVRSVTRPKRQTRVAIDATLRASAPHQQLRHLRSEGISSLDPESNKLPTRALTRRVRIEPNDLRFKEFKHRAGILFILAVDASGSMALNRMAQAKGAVVRLLQHAYLHRDKVALLCFRGTTSELLLAPTRSVELAKRLVDAMPAGGGTPLAAGVMKAIELSRLARLRGTSQTMLVLFTDGRANVCLRGGLANAATIDEELLSLGALVGAEEILAVVVDTKSKFVSRGEGEALARKLGARYVYLPRADAGAVYDAISSIAVRPIQN